MATKSAPLRRVQVRCLMPLWSRFEIVFRDDATGEIEIVKVVWASRARWQRWTASHQMDDHRTISIGPFILAIGLE